MRALAFGEILYDIIGGEEFLGGAPLNLAAHLSRCRMETAYVSRVGDDERGRRALGEMLGLGIRNDFMQIDPDHQTGTVDVDLSAGGQPSYTIHENVAYDHIDPMEIPSAIIAYAPRVVCFGTIVQRSQSSRQSLYSMLDRLPGIEMLYDVNLRQAYYDRAWIERSLWYATIVKLNAEEVDILGELLFGQKLKLETFAERLADQWKLKALLLTLGAAHPVRGKKGPSRGHRWFRRCFQCRIPARLSSGKTRRRSCRNRKRSWRVRCQHAWRNPGIQ
jgi:fructokinase